MSTLRPKQQAVDLDEGLSDDPETEPRDPAQKTGGNVLARPVGGDVDERKGGSDARAAVHYLEPRTSEERRVSGKSEVLEVVRVAVEGLEEWRCRKHETTRPQHAKHLGDRVLGSLEVLEDGLAVQSADGRRREGKVVRVPDDVHVREQSQVQVQEAGVRSKRSAPDRDRGTRGLSYETERPARPLTPGRIDLPQPTCERSGTAVLTREVLDNRQIDFVYGSAARCVAGVETLRPAKNL